MRNMHMEWDDLRDGAKVEAERLRSGYIVDPQKNLDMFVGQLIALK